MSCSVPRPHPAANIRGRSIPTTFFYSCFFLGPFVCRANLQQALSTQVGRYRPRQPRLRPVSQRVCEGRYRWKPSRVAIGVAFSGSKRSCSTEKPTVATVGGWSLSEHVFAGARGHSREYPPCSAVSLSFRTVIILAIRSRKGMVSYAASKKKAAQVFISVRCRVTCASGSNLWGYDTTVPYIALIS